MRKKVARLGFTFFLFKKSKIYFSPPHASIGWGKPKKWLWANFDNPKMRYFTNNKNKTMRNKMFLE